MDVIVFRGGLAGIAAAAYLGQTKRSVIVLERSSHVVGRAVTQPRPPQPAPAVAGWLELSSITASLH